MLKFGRTRHAIGLFLLGGTALAASCAGSGSRARPAQAPPPAPILADEAGTPGSVEEECQRVVVDLKRYGRCGLLDDDRRWWMGKWGEYVENDLALVKNPKIDAESKQQIAVSCRKAALVVSWAAAVCDEQAAAKAAEAEAAAGTGPATAPR